MPRIGFFLPLAVAEHVLVILFSAWLIYQPPSLRIEETEYVVEIFKEDPPPEKKKIEEPLAFVLESEAVPVDLPPLQSLQNLDSFFSDSSGNTELPDVRRLTSRTSDQQSIDISIPYGQKQRSTEIDVDAAIRAKTFSDEIGHQSTANPIGTTDSTGKVLRTTGDNPAFTGKVASEGRRQSQPSKAVGERPYSITGIDPGRGILHEPSLPKVVGEVQGGVVRLSFIVKPNGTVYQVRIIENRAGELGPKARIFVSQIIFNKLASNLPQRNQSGEITVRFERQQ